MESMRSSLRKFEAKDFLGSLRVVHYKETSILCPVVDNIHDVAIIFRLCVGSRGKEGFTAKAMVAVGNISYDLLVNQVVFEVTT